MKYVKLILFLVVLMIVSNRINAQTVTPEWDSPQLQGERYLNRLHYQGQQYCPEKWTYGVVYLNGNDSVTNVQMKYNLYVDEIVYLNPRFMLPVKIDKETVSGFAIELDGKRHIFEKKNFPYFPKGDRYFEILYSGKYSLIVQRRADLLACSVYADANGVNKNQEFVRRDKYFIFDQDKGFRVIAPKRKSILAKFMKQDKPAIKKVLRKNSLDASNEFTLIRAWAEIEKLNIDPIF